MRRSAVEGDPRAAPQDGRGELRRGDAAPGELAVTGHQEQGGLRDGRLRLDERLDTGARGGPLAQLGEVATQLTALVRAVAEQAMGGGAPAEALASLLEIEGRMGDVVGVAAEMLEVAKNLEMGDLIAEVDSIRQQVQAAQGKVQAIREKLGGPIGQA